MQRPVILFGSYSCPRGTKPCNPSFLASAELVEYVVCIAEGEEREEACPITSYAFSLVGMNLNESQLYKQAKTLDTSSATKQFYFSKETPNHAIDEIRVIAGAPCWNKD